MKCLYVLCCDARVEVSQEDAISVQLSGERVEVHSMSACTPGPAADGQLIDGARRQH